MPETFNIASLVDTARTYLAFRAGEAQLGALDTCILIMALSGALVAALNLWRIGRREDFQERLDGLRGTTLTRAAPTHPQHPPWYHRLGAAIATTPIIGTTEQRALLTALAAAGIRGHGRLASLLTAKGCSAVAFVMAGWLLLEWRELFADSTTIRLAVLACAVLLGWRIPDVILSRLAARRQLRLEQGMPDALDLLVFCAEAGLSLDGSLTRVAREIGNAAPELADELGLTAIELGFLPNRTEALRNLQKRADMPSIRGVINTLVQTERYGTPLASSLRVLTAEYRDQRMMKAEEKAGRLPATLTVPMILFILPTLFIVLCGPAAINVMHTLRGH